MRSDPFAVHLTRQTEKDLGRLKQWTRRAVDALLVLEEDPHRGHTLTGDLKGARSLEFSLPGGSVYRAVYVVLEEDHVCIVFLIGTHEGIYQKAARRLAALRKAGAI